MSATRIEIDPRECVRVASFIHDRAEENRSSAILLAQTSAGAPLMPPGIGAVVTETVCNANRMLSSHAADLDRQARVLEIAARIIELDQDVAGARWGLGAIDAAFTAVMNGGRGHTNAVEALEILLSSSNVMRLTVSDWQDIAYFKAGIDPDEWDPQRGLLALDEIVRKVYAYYGELYLDNPNFLWAAMANLVGPMFYAGWQDIYVIRHVADDGQRMKYLSELFGFPVLPGFVYDIQDHLGLELPPERILEHLTSEELEYFEHKFLEMQKRIFDDLAWQHEAYMHGGLPLISKLLTEANDLRDLRAWIEIDSGDPVRVQNGNYLLLAREQVRIIQPDYDAMRAHHGPVGWSFTYAVTWLADSPFDDGRSYREFDGVTIDPIPEVRVGPVEIPIVGPVFVPDVEVRVPTGNISYMEDRMAWINEDMWPDFVAMTQDPERMQADVRRPVAERAEGFRKLDALPYPR